MVISQTHGIGRYTFHLINELSQLKDVEVSVLFHKNETKDLFKNIKVKKFYKTLAPFASPLSPLLLGFRLLTLPKFDIIHFTSYDVPLFTPENSVITLHDLIHLINPTLPKLLYFNFIVGGALKKCACVIAVSEETKKQIGERFSFAKNKTHVVRNGLEEYWLKSPSTNQPQSSKNILALGNTKPHKNVQTLIRACEALWKEQTQFELFLSLGGQQLPQGWLNPKWKSRIHLIQGLSDLKLKELYENATALVSTSIEEGFNYPIAEALSQGLPVICSDIPAHREFGQKGIEFYGAPQDMPALRNMLSKRLSTKEIRSTDLVHFSRSSREVAADTLQIYRQSI
jgi:glycosyltransferase involved in cell wall biosynthesis